ncbi:MAG: type II toxin-antitoxin system VapC family toxin [Verrucomicrobiota bacterium]
MITAVDTAVLISIDQGEPDGTFWLEQLKQARRSGALVICDVVAAEFFASIMDEAECLNIMKALGLTITPLSISASFHAGSVFRKYREARGPREHLIPDFLIAAHAQVVCDRLLSPDRGYLRQYFPDLHVIRPE